VVCGRHLNKSACVKEVEKIPYVRAHVCTLCECNMLELCLISNEISNSKRFVSRTYTSMAVLDMSGKEIIGSLIDTGLFF